MTFKEAMKASETGYVKRYDADRGVWVFRTARREYISDAGTLRPVAGTVTKEIDWEPVQPVGNPDGGIPARALATSAGMAVAARRDRHMWTKYPAMLKKQNEKAAAELKASNEQREREQSRKDQGPTSTQV